MITPTTHLFTAGETLHDDILNRGIRDVYDFLQEPPQFVMRQTTAQSFLNSTWTDVTNWTVDKDNDNFRSAGGAGITISTSGFYTFTYGIGFANVNSAADTTGFRVVGLVIHGFYQGNHYSRPSLTAGMWWADIGAVYGCYMTAGDTVFFRARQSSGVTLNSKVDQVQAHWSGHWISQ